MRVAFFASAVPFVLATIVPFAMVYLIVGVNINIPVIVDIVIVVFVFNICCLLVIRCLFSFFFCTVGIYFGV